MKHKVRELDGTLLAAAVAKCEGDRLPDYWLDPGDGTPWLRPGREEWRPNERWDQGGPIIERERISLVYCEPGTTAGEPWEAYIGSLCPRRLDNDPASGEGPTPLIAAMRAYVASKMGEEVELP